MTSIEINDCFDELKDENIRLENELKFANKCLIVLNKIRFNLNQLFCLQTNSNQLIFNETVIHIFKQLDQEFNSIIADKPMMKTIQITLPLRSVPKKINSKPKQMITKALEDHQKNKPEVIITKQSPNDMSINENPMVSQNNDSNQSTKQSLNSKTKKVITKPTEVHFKGTDLMSIVSNRPKISPFRPNVSQNPKPKDDPIVNSVVIPTTLTIVSKIDSIINKNTSILTKRKNRVDSKDRNKCQNCDQKFASKQSLQNHDSIHHKKESPVVCPMDGCHKLVRPYALKSHLLIHSKPLLACDWPGCNYKHKLPHKLLRHKQTTHSSQKNYVCDWPQCDKRFKSPDGLKLHKRTHSNVKSLSCVWPGCEYKAWQSGHVKLHYRTHTKEKPHSCDWPGCEYRCSAPQGLTRHYNTIHEQDPLKKLKYLKRKVSSERKYVCDWPQCDKRYNRNDSLLSHLKTHTNKTIMCEWKGCQYRTHTSFRMKIHFMTHTKEKPFMCGWPQCKYRSAFAPNLRRHMKRHQKD